jgi:peptidoglycan/LPS O-acetylase OafA/YrhL
MDATRALAALAVVIYHLRGILFLDADAGLSAPWKIFYFATGFGHQAVMIFFVLSGYWITKTVARRSAGGGFAWSDYAIDRLSRLWVVLIPALLLGGIFDSIGRYEIAAPIYLGVQGTNTLLAYDVASHLSLRNFVGSLAFVQTLLVKPFGSNGSLWSLANEFWYYVWFPPLYLSLRGRRPSIAVTFVLITMAAFPTLLPGFVCWLFGSLLFYATQTATIHTAPRPRMVVALSAAILLFFGVLVTSRIPNLPVDGSIQDLAISGSFALLLFVLIRSARTYPHWLTPLCRYGAGSSYSLYAVHFPLVVLLAALFVTPAHRLAPSGRLLVSFVLIAFVAIVFGYGLSVVTEANTSKLRRLLKKKYANSLQHPPAVPPIKSLLRDD